MSNHVSYQGKDLGEIKPDEHHKLVFIADGLESLDTLLGLEPEDEIELEGKGRMPYEIFRDKHLKNIKAFYPTMDDFLLKNYEANALDEFPMI